MYKAGGPWNPRDPASLAMPATEEEFQARYLREIEAEREVIGETLEEQLLRQKRGWAEKDGKSAKPKEEGNIAFRNGDYTRAYVIYTACIYLSSRFIL
ncbi:hypothetical protein B0H16DRAFT_1718968 [Mycena metata]|uniref:Uncharacterized protein n=1 Tax=Mycena metata TaxID=1033252 RepID=A0AAD7JDI9_9AGAR|nr:hypothetical protein B0H16DRAFT_1718968 [Mycena metata]